MLSSLTYSKDTWGAYFRQTTQYPNFAVCGLTFWLFALPTLQVQLEELEIT